MNPITIDAHADQVPEFLRELNYSFAGEDAESRVFTKTVHGSASMTTPLGVLYVAVNHAQLFVRHDRGDNSYRLGIKQGDSSDVSMPFTEEDFQAKLIEFESKLNA